MTFSVRLCGFRCMQTFKAVRRVMQTTSNSNYYWIFINSK